MGVFDYLKTAGDVAVNLRNVELQGTLLEIKREILARDERILQLERRNAELERERDVKQTLEYREPSYYLKKPDGTEDGPFCARCQDAEKKLIRTHDANVYSGRQRQCPECETKIMIERRPAPQPKQDEGSWIRARQGY